MDVVRLLGSTDEVERMLSILPYHWVFTIDEPCLEELITEFYASFKFYGSDVMFQLRGVICRLMMQEFRVALELWTMKEQSTDVYAIAVRYFTEDISVYWMHISCEVLLLYSSRRRALALSRYFDTSTLSLHTLLWGGRTIRRSSPPQMSGSFPIFTEASRWTWRMSSLDRLGTMLLPLVRRASISVHSSQEW